MEYELKHGNSDTSILQQALKNGEDLPDFIKNKPELIHESLQFYLQAFFVLESERQVGYAGVSPIPVMSIINYGRFLGYVDNSQLHDFVNIVRMLDQVALSSYNESK